MRTRPSDGVVLVAVIAWISGILQLFSGAVMLFCGGSAVTGWLHIVIGVVTFPVVSRAVPGATSARIIVTLVFLLKMWRARRAHRHPGCSRTPPSPRRCWRSSASCCSTPPPRTRPSARRRRRGNRPRRPIGLRRRYGAAAIRAARGSAEGGFMSIKVALEHYTAYKFARPVTVQPHVIRLRPAPHSHADRGVLTEISPKEHFVNWQQARSATGWRGSSSPRRSAASRSPSASSPTSWSSIRSTSSSSPTRSASRSATSRRLRRTSRPTSGRSATAIASMAGYRSFRHCPATVCRR